MSSRIWLKTRRRLTGIVFLVVFALLVWLSIALYDKDFTPVALVTLETGSAGNELHVQADVKVRGVTVGEVRQITASGSGARLELALHPDALSRLPANVTAQLLPTTLFGERYVDLIVPAHPDPAHLTAGSVIGEDRSKDAIELQQVLRNLMTLLQAVQPAKLAVTLTAVSQALQGRGTELGQTLVNIGSYLQRMNPELPEVDNDIAQLVTVVNDYAKSAPDVVGALSDFATTSKTIVDQQRNLESLYGNLTTASDDLGTFLHENGPNLIRLSADAGPALETLARYSPEFPCVLRQLTAFTPAMDRALGKGTNQPGMHVTITVVPSAGKYVPGADRPVYDTDTGPRCYSVQAAAETGTNPAGSPGEGELVRELAGAQLGVPPSTLPGWSDVLVGGLFRGVGVTVK